MPQRTNTDGAVGTALDSRTVDWAWIIRLEVETDPLYAWTGFGDLTFTPGQTGDTKLDGMTFTGITHLVAQVGSVQDKQGGSGPLEIALPGVNLMDEAMKQVIYDQRKWQRKPGYVWVALFDTVTGALIGKPISVRRGLMDQMVVEETDAGGVIRCTIEGQQAYASPASGSRYSEQAELDATDNSQQHVWTLANMSADLNKADNTSSKADKKAAKKAKKGK